MVKVKSNNQTEQVSAVQPNRRFFLKRRLRSYGSYGVGSVKIGVNPIMRRAPRAAEVKGYSENDVPVGPLVEYVLDPEPAVHFTREVSWDDFSEPSPRDLALEAIEVLQNVSSDDAKLGALLAKTSAHLESLTLELVGHHERARQQLSESSAFKDASVTDLLVLKRFAERRDTLLEKYDFVDKLELAQFLGFPTGTSADKHNVNRRLNSLREKKKILSVNYRDEAIYPLFQFDESLNWHEALLKRLPDLLDSRSGWDVCFWLDTERSVLVERAVATDQQIEEALAAGPETYDKLVQAQAEQTIYESHSPLSLLAQKKYDLFDIFCEDLVNPEHRVIAEKPLEA